ncbi:MAG: hypothetical protein IPI29_08850 [Ignavibacteria bacterium]|nr:hypothetical protein [Ignavibacteria bacterium]
MKIPVHLRAIVALVVCALLWSSGGLLIKTLPLSPLTIAGARSAIAALVILVGNGMFVQRGRRRRSAVS